MKSKETYSGTLLVVDDFELNRDMLSRRLKSRGFEAHTAASGQEALALVADVSFDVILLDIMMPDMDGYHVLRKIREEHSSTDVAVIMVTAKDQSEDIVQALDDGADDYITKPIDFAVALARIRKQLKRRATENALKESEERYALAANGANDGLWDWNLRTHALYYSDRWKLMLGYQPDEISDDIDEWLGRVHADDLQRLKDNLEKHMSGISSMFSCEYRMALKDGSYRWMLCRGSTVCDDTQGTYRMVGWQTDTTNRVQHDSLTSLPNRALFLDRMGSAFARSRRSSATEICVYYLGIDRFKIINEALGHDMGDQLLIQVAKRLDGVLRPGDTMARLGGDEFSILAEGVPGVSAAVHLANRIREYIAKPFHLDEQEIHLTLSIGIVLAEHDLIAPEELLRRAHTAMDTAKAKGKDSFEFFEGEKDQQISSALQMENNLRKAVERDELFLLYQPQISTESGQIVGVEALVRWRDPSGKVIPPFHFIPLAEESGLIVPIGEWIIRTACKQNKVWQDMGLPKIVMGVNLSSRQFRQQNLVEVVCSALEEADLEPKYLDLELTESLLMENVEQTIKDLERLHDLGVHISIDDFGTGYSSLSYLKRFRIDTLKIDQSFVRDITTDPGDAAISSAIINMAHSLNMNVIAEGVETYEHLQFLKKLDCDQMQGYYFSKPAPSENIVAFLKEYKVYK